MKTRERYCKCFGKDYYVRWTKRWFRWKIENILGMPILYRYNKTTQKFEQIV